MDLGLGVHTSRRGPSFHRLPTTFLGGIVVFYFGKDVGKDRGSDKKKQKEKDDKHKRSDEGVVNH